MAFVRTSCAIAINCYLLSSYHHFSEYTNKLSINVICNRYRFDAWSLEDVRKDKIFGIIYYINCCYEWQVNILMIPQKRTNRSPNRRNLLNGFLWKQIYCMFSVFYWIHYFIHRSYPIAIAHIHSGYVSLIIFVQVIVDYCVGCWPSWSIIYTSAETIEVNGRTVGAREERH